MFGYKAFIKIFKLCFLFDSQFLHQVYNIFGICDAYNETFAHPPDLIVDNHDEENPTWWQSISWYDYPLPREINVTFSLDHSYTLVDNINILFQSGPPQQMILEKSNDGGVTWEILQYYSTDCTIFSNVSTIKYHAEWLFLDSVFVTENNLIV